MAELSDIRETAVARGREFDPPRSGGPQLARYRRLGREAASVERRVGHVRVCFAEPPPAGLLERTLDVERRCCPFVHATYDERRRQLTMTVETADQSPRLDSLFDAIARSM